jgi:hypothetical protein
VALTPKFTEHARTAGHIPHEAQVRVDKRVERILARREHARPATPAAAARPQHGGDAELRRNR